MTECQSGSMKRVVAVLVGLGSLSLSGAFAEDCQRGEQMFEQSKTEPQASQRIVLLERSASLCGRFATHYALGRERLALGVTGPAAEAFETALQLAGDDRAAMLALGRLAEVRYEQGRIGEAVAALEGAYGRLAAVSPPQAAPPWLAALRRTLDVRMASTVVTADTMRSIFTSFATRGIGVVPRVQLPVQFDYDSSELAAEGISQVTELGMALATPKLLAPQQKIRVVGHTDARGTDAYNDRLSLARAQTVARALEQRLPELAGRIVVEGHGRHELRHEGNDEETHRLNRRVEIRIEPGLRTAGP